MTRAFLFVLCIRRLVAVFLLTLAVDLRAQSATGTVEGRVQNATNGMYLNNARVTVEGTDLEVFTNQYGDYRISGVPAGTATIRVVFTGLEPQTASVTVAADQPATRDFHLQALGSTETGEVVKLDEFVVANQRETNAAAIAANEQRFSPNIKNVVAADAFGDVTEGNVGEFVKYLPGVTVDYVAADVRTISVRGFADNFTSVNVDGNRMASSASGNAIRTFELEQVSINNVARVEVTKVPTPEMSADGLGGSVNLVSKNAFEAAKPSIKVRTYLSLNNEDMDFHRKTPGPGNKKTYKGLPGFDFSYVAPLSDTFGVVINGLSSNQFNEQHRSQPTWRFVGAGSSIASPYLRQYQVQDGPKNTFRDSLSVKADWKFAPNQVLSAGWQSNYYKSFFGNRNLNYDVGSNNTPTPSSGTALTYSPTFTHGATGRGSVTEGSSFRDKLGATNGLNLNYVFTGSEWKLNAGANWSKSRTWYRDISRGHFSGVSTSVQGVSVVNYDGIDYPRPASLTALTSAGAPIDVNNLANHRLTTMRTQPVDGVDQFTNFQVDVKRDLKFLPLPVSIKAGVADREQNRNMRRYQSDTTFVGADGIANSTDDAALPFLDAQYSSEDPYWGFSPIQWTDPYKVGALYASNPSYFVPTVAQAGAAERFRVMNSQYITERVSSAFVMGDARLFHSRLLVLTGVRFEKTKDDGLGAKVDRKAVLNPDGTRKAAAGAVGSLQEALLTHQERQFAASRSYDGYYPSLHATLNITDNLLARFAYARTLGRPDFSNILPLARINDDTIDFADGGSNPTNIPARTIIVNNTGLRPWTADNWDLALEYYFPKGGMFSTGVFRKDISDFFGTSVKGGTASPLTAADLEAYDLDPIYAGTDMKLQSTINAGDARVTGIEFNFTQPLTILGEWGRSFNFIANGTLLHLTGSNEADFDRFIEKSGNLGITYSHRPLVVQLKWNYRGRQRNSQQESTAPGAFEYYAPRANLDVNVEYQFSRRISFFANARNVLNKEQVLERFSSATPDYSHFFRAEKFGVQMALGLKGSF